MSISVIDEAVPAGGKDDLGIETHAKALSLFIETSETPITIGIQGEWGSGKTSLLNFIVDHFDRKPDVKQIWINSWEYSLLSNPEEALLKIVHKILAEILASDPDKERSEKIKKGAETIFKGALRLGAHMTMGAAGAQIAQETLSELSSGQNITELRQQLSQAVTAMSNSPTNPYERIIIYVDDLDRIEPRNAVAILELLKNIFSVPNCIFVLAIDYQVIVKGLAEKFGPPTPENEWEFKAFFDKIIQLPFMMPLGQYDIGNYVNNLLKRINFSDGDDFDPESVANVISYTIGGNPRSIKRLANSASLIVLFAKLREEDIQDAMNDATEFEFPDGVDEKMLLFCILCLQIAYPKVYSLLTLSPDFATWDETFAFSITKKKEESEESFKEEFHNAIETDDFDEDWERALFRICYPSPGLRNRSSDISQFFSFIKDQLFAEHQNKIGKGIAAVLTRTSVTSVTATNENSPKLKATARSALDGGLEEFGAERNWSPAELDAMRRLQHLEKKDSDLKFKVTKTQISISNLNTSTRSKVIIYTGQIVKGKIRLGLVGQQDDSTFCKVCKILDRSSAISRKTNKKGDVFCELDVDYGDEDFNIIYEWVRAYKNKIHKSKI